MMICDTISTCDILTQIQHLKAINILKIESLFSNWAERRNHAVHEIIYSAPPLHNRKAMRLL